MKNTKDLLHDFARRITGNAHFEHTGNNVHRVIEVETAINVFAEMIGEQQRKADWEVKSGYEMLPDRNKVKPTPVNNDEA